MQGAPSSASGRAYPEGVIRGVQCYSHLHTVTADREALSCSNPSQMTLLNTARATQNAHLTASTLGQEKLGIPPEFKTKVTAL